MKAIKRQMKNIERERKELKLKAMIQAMFAPLFTLVMAFMMGSPVFAAVDVSAVVRPIYVIITVIIAIVAAVGIILAILGVVDLVAAVPSGDTGGIKAGAFKLGAGAIMVGIGAIVTLMGFTIL
ncbi:uncharacterized protein YacL [Lachnospiraceae bacterium PF1-21]